MDFAIFFQSVKADFKPLFTGKPHKAFKKVDARWPDEENDVLIQRFSFSQIGIKVSSRT